MQQLTGIALLVLSTQKAQRVGGMLEWSVLLTKPRERKLASCALKRAKEIGRRNGSSPKIAMSGAVDAMTNATKTPMLCLNCAPFRTSLSNMSHTGYVCVCVCCLSLSLSLSLSLCARVCACGGNGLVLMRSIFETEAGWHKFESIAVI
eukprot:COSAG05_NODE_8940_length_659_cov_14.513193_2_plen_148_part_01